MRLRLKRKINPALTHRDQRLCSRCVERVEGGAEIGVHSLVPIAECQPVAAQLADTATLCQNLDIAELCDVLSSGMLVALDRSVLLLRW
jgi:hypothetical protein